MELYTFMAIMGPLSVTGAIIGFIIGYKIWLNKKEKEKQKIYKED